MVTKSKGTKFSVNDYFRTFLVGQKVAIVLNSSSQSMPFRRFHGLAGKVVSKRGSAYLVNIKDGSKEKQVIAKSEHLKLLKV